MKKLYGALYALSLLSLVVAGVFIALMPEQIPAHYNIAGEVDRFGSKYETLLFPALIILTGIGTTAIAKAQAKKGAAQNERILLITGLCMVAFFNFQSVYFLLKAYTYAGEAAPLDPWRMAKFSAIAFGALLMVLGNIMPKARLNALFGLRTQWSMANERVWQQSQRFGGYASVACGIAMILCGMFLQGVLCLFFIIGLMTLWVALCIVASYQIYKKDAQNEE